VELEVEAIDLAADRQICNAQNEFARNLR
jgi:hypothetical protein